MHCIMLGGKGCDAVSCIDQLYYNLLGWGVLSYFCIIYLFSFGVVNLTSAIYTACTIKIL